MFTVAGQDTSDLTRIAAALSELRLTILDEELIRRDHAGAFFNSTEGERSNEKQDD